MKSTIIGIAGGTGSGKSTLVQLLIERFGEKVTVLSHDNYYKRHDDMTYAERARLNYDHPDAFDTELMVEHLKKLKNGEAIDCPIYDFSVHNRTDAVRQIAAHKVIVVEGILILHSKALCEMMDVKLFVDTDADVRLCRRVERDVLERGRTVESVIGQYRATVKPMHEQFVEPSRKNADLIIPNGGKNPVAVQLLFDRIENLLNEV